MCDNRHRGTQRLTILSSGTRGVALMTCGQACDDAPCTKQAFARGSSDVAPELTRPLLVAHFCRRSFIAKRNTLRCSDQPPNTSLTCFAFRFSCQHSWHVHVFLPESTHSMPTCLCSCNPPSGTGVPHLLLPPLQCRSDTETDGHCDDNSLRTG